MARYHSLGLLFPLYLQFNALLTWRGEGNWPYLREQEPQSTNSFQPNESFFAVNKTFPPALQKPLIPCRFVSGCVSLS